MAPRKPAKPKGILDNPLGEINKLYNAVMPGGRDVTQPQSLAQFKDVVRNTVAGTVKAADLYTTGGLGVSFAQNVIQPAALIASAETRNAATSKGMTQFAKDAAINAASAGAGYVAGKAVQAGAAKVVESGLAARLSNIVKGETPLLHGSPLSKLPVIKPQLGSKTFPEDKVAYGWNAEQMLKVNEGRMGPLMDQTLAKTTTESGLGTVYVTMGKNKSNIITDAERNFMMATTKPQKIVKAFNRADYIGNEKRLEADVLAALQRAGVKVKPVKPNKRRAPRPLPDDSSPV